jgi:hypothetical protein
MIAWHVDDLKITHVDPEVVTTIIANLLDAKYGQEIVGIKRAPLTVNQGTIHDYLTMTLDYSEASIVKVNMTDYVKKSSMKHPKRWMGPRPHPPLTTYSGSLKELNYWTAQKANLFVPLLPRYYSYASAEGQTFKPRSSSCARESNNQLSMTSTSFPSDKIPPTYS